MSFRRQAMWRSEPVDGALARWWEYTAGMWFVVGTERGGGRRAAVSAGVLVFGISVMCSALRAQSEADRELLKKMRSQYRSAASRPAYIACEDNVDWDAVAQEPGVQLQPALSLLKEMRISFVSRGWSSTEVIVTGDPSLAKQKEKVRKQLKAFFHEYWVTADGRLLPRSKIPYQIASSDGGYVTTQDLPSGPKVRVELDKAFVITRAHSLEGPQTAELTPKFDKEDDGLLHVRHLGMDERLGESKLVFEYDLDYQKVGGYYVPRHVTMSMPGALRFAHTFSNCDALNKTNAPPLTDTGEADEE